MGFSLMIIRWYFACVFIVSVLGQV